MDRRILRKRFTPHLLFMICYVLCLCCLLSCGEPPEPITKVLDRVGDVELVQKDITLGKLNEILQRNGEVKSHPEINTTEYQWFDEAIIAKFIDASNSMDNAKLIDLEIHRIRPEKHNFQGSIFGVHINDAPENIPEILRKAHCEKIEQNHNSGSATNGNNWSVTWFMNLEGKLDSFSISDYRYVNIKVSK
jgi:hypothetical protein